MGWIALEDGAEMMSTQVAELTFGTASERDLPGVAAVYLAAFPDSVEHYFGNHPPAPQALVDLFLVPLSAEPECLIVARSRQEVVGYCLAPAHTDRLARAAWSHAGRFLIHWLGRRYHIGLRTLLRLTREKL